MVTPGLKQTTEVNWTGVMLEAEELARIVHDAAAAPLVGAA